MEKEREFSLVKRFLSGDETAFNLIVSNYKEKIYWHARRMLGNHSDADEVTQVVLITLYKKLNSFKFQSSLYTWIYKITSTKSINLIKKRNIRKLLSMDDEKIRNLKKSEDVATAFEDREKLEKLDQILFLLPPRQREVFILRNFDQMSYEEISTITGKTVGALKASYFHSFKKILELMPDE